MPEEAAAAGSDALPREMYGFDLKTYPRRISQAEKSMTWSRLKHYCPLYCRTCRQKAKPPSSRVRTSAAALGGQATVRFCKHLLEIGRQRWQHKSMKHDHLCAIGHNIADSLASGMCFVIGIWSLDVFGEAAAGDGVIEVDFLHGRIVHGACSENLRKAVTRFANVLPGFCLVNGADVANFEALAASFDATALPYRVSLKIADRSGRHSVTEYSGLPLTRLRVLDPLGRIRRIPRRTITIERQLPRIPA